MYLTSLVLQTIHFLILIFIRYSPDKWISVDVFVLIIGLFPLVPVPLLFYEFSEQWFKTKYLKITSKINVKHLIMSTRISDYNNDIDDKEEHNDKTLGDRSIAIFTAIPTKSGNIHCVDLVHVQHRNIYFVVFERMEIPI